MSARGSNQGGNPLLPASRVLITVTHRVDSQLRCARDYGVGVEIQTFAHPLRLSNETVKEVQRMAQRVARLKGHVGCHGAFIDIIHHSMDPEVAKVARMRYMQAFDFAEILGAGYIVFHSQYNPLIKIPEYPDLYHRQSLVFWPEFIREAERRRIPIYLENMFEDSPEPLCRLVEAFDSPHLRVCMDIAHVMINSRMDIAEWIDAFGQYLSHVHVNDCDGMHDNHLALGEGDLDLPRALALLKRTRLPLTYAIETDEGARASLRYLGLRRR